MVWENTWREKKTGYGNGISERPRKKQGASLILPGRKGSFGAPIVGFKNKGRRKFETCPK